MLISNKTLNGAAHALHSSEQNKQTHHSSETDMHTIKRITQEQHTHRDSLHMHMEPRSMQDGDVVNMTRAMEALSPWLNHPRRTIIKVEALVLTAAALLLLQLILGSCKRRWHNSFIRYGLQVCNGIMFPLIVYTLGTMQSSPIKNSSYPIWAAFLIMASAGTTAVRQYDFYGSFGNKYLQVFGEYLRDAFYVLMFLLLLDPNNYTLKSIRGLIIKGHGKNSRASSWCVINLVIVVMTTKVFESICLVYSGYGMLRGEPFARIMKLIRLTQAAAAQNKQETTTANDDDDASSDSDDPYSIKGYKYAVCYRLFRGGVLTIDQIWDSYGNSSDANALKDLCLSYALSRRLRRQRYFGLVSANTNRPKDHDFVFKKLLPPAEEYFQRAFRIIEVELGFCYDFFFTKYTFFWTNFLPVPLIQSLILLKIILILVVGVIAVRQSLVLETPNPIIEVHISEADYIITLLLVGIAFLVELAQAALYLASNWAQVSLACLHVKKKCCREPSAYIFGKVIGLLGWVMSCGQLMMRKRINQHSVIFGRKQPDPVVVSDAMKKAIARSLRSTYATNLTTNEELSARLQNQMLDEYSWALKDFSHLEVMFIWHIATQYCNAISDDDNPNDGDRTTPSGNNHLAPHLFRYLVIQWLGPDPRRNRVASDSHRGVAVHLCRYCAYLTRSVPELLPFHEVDIAELEQEVMEERMKYFGSYYRLDDIYNEMKKLGTEDTREMFQQGVKLGKQLEEMADGDRRWQVLEDFWAKKIIHLAASHYTTKQHMQHLENGGEFLTHIWALLAHAGVLNLDRGKDQEGQANNLGSGTSAATC